MGVTPPPGIQAARHLTGATEPRPRVIERSSGPRLAAAMFRATPGAPGVVVVPGLGSRKDNHLDFASSVAERGMAALAVDVRGHGQSGGDVGRGLLDDVLAAVDELVVAGYGPIGVRGSSLGGFLALHAAERRAVVTAVVAICPVSAAGLARRVGEPWPLELGDADDSPPRQGVARAYWHARDDEQVPWAGTFALFQRSPEPRRLRIEMGGSHRSLQHDPRVIADSVDFLATSLGRR